MKKNKKIFIILLITILNLILLSIGSLAVTTGKFSANTTSNNLNIGETTNLSITVTNCEGRFSITSSDSNIVSVSSASEWVSGTTNITLTAKNSGTATITVIAENVGDNQEEPEDVTGSQSVTITVQEPQQPEQPPEQQPDQSPETPSNQEPQQPTVTFTDTNKTMYVTVDSLNIRQSYNTSSKPIGSLSKGNAVNVIAIGSNGWYKIKMANGQEGYVASGSDNEKYLTDTKPNQNKSSVATLASLIVSSGNLNETFSKDRQSYTMTVNADVDSVDVEAKPTDEKARVTVTGNKGLKTGTDNTITIRVLAEDETSTKIYKIQVTKLATEDENPNIIDEDQTQEKTLGLSSLTIEKLKLTPTFNSNIYEYTATLTDKTIEKLNVNAIASLEDAKVEITGADEIKDGENVITIIVTSADGEQTITYQVVVNKKEPTVIAKVEPKQEDNTKLFLVIGIVVAIIILIVIIIVTKKIKERPTKIYEDDDYNEPEEYHSSSNEKYEQNSENSEEIDEEYYDDEEDEDDDWGAPKRGIFGNFKKNGRH